MLKNATNWVPACYCFAWQNKNNISISKKLQFKVHKNHFFDFFLDFLTQLKHTWALIYVYQSQFIFVSSICDKEVKKNLKRNKIS